MTHLRFALMIACLVALSTGCRMCASPFDYCGPTATGGCGEECGPCAPRSGSILTGASQMSHVEDEVPYVDGGVVESEPTMPSELGRDAFDAPIMSGQMTKAPVMPRQMVGGEMIEGVIISVDEGKPKEISESQTLNASRAKPAPTADSSGWSGRQ